MSENLIKNEKEIIQGNNISIVQPLWHLALLSIFSFGLYHYYWIYRNFKFHKKLNEESESPFWATFLFAVPIFDFFITWICFNKTIKNKKVFTFIMAFMFCLLINISRIPIYIKNLSSFEHLNCFAIIFLLIVQNNINKEFTNGKIKKRLNLIEKIIILVGFILIIFLNK